MLNNLDLLGVRRTKAAIKTAGGDAASMLVNIENLKMFNGLHNKNNETPDEITLEDHKKSEES